MIRTSPTARRSAGIVTGVLLAVARISGETAPLLFTALNNQFCSAQSQRADGRACRSSSSSSRCSPYEDWQQLAWTGALLITVAVLALSIVARVSQPRERRHERTSMPPCRPVAPRTQRDIAERRSRSAISISTTATAAR